MESWWKLDGTPVVTVDSEGHSKYLWQCEQGIDPPYPPEPWPEPAPFYLVGGGVLALAFLRRRRQIRR